jgi:hypothetical protein
MIKKKNKKAQGHVEIILSFLIFIGALIFLFIFINPFAKTEEVSVIDGLQRKIIEEISLEIGKLGVITSCELCCYNFTLEDYVGNYQEKQEASRKYSIYFGEIFNNISNRNPLCDPSNYTLGTYSKEKMIVENKTLELVIQYNTDYESLKNNLGITNEFAFNFKNLVGEEILLLTVSKQPPVGVNVEAREFPIRMIDNNTNIQELILNIRAWE